MPFPIADLLDACLDERVPIVSTFWGDPDAAGERIHAGGVLHHHTVGTADEAVQSESVMTSAIMGASGIVPSSSIAESRRTCADGIGIARETGTVRAVSRNRLRVLGGLRRRMVPALATDGDGECARSGRQHDDAGESD